MKTLSIILALAGLALSTLIVGWYGAAGVAGAIGAVGWGGFALMIAWQAGVFVLLATGWLAVARGAHWRRFPAFLLGRAVRDAAGQFLPFLQLGGFVMGARAATLLGLRWPLSAASTMADVTVEFLAQIVFSLLGLAALALTAPESEFILPIGLAILAAILLAGFAIILQLRGGGLVRKLAPRIGGTALLESGGHIGRVQARLERIYAARSRLVLGVTVHLLAWFATAGASWLAFRLMGYGIDYPAALAIEALLHVALTIAFIVPGALGVQEAAYVALGGIFGVPPEAAVSVSLLRRGRDLVYAVPVLLAWQWAEARRLGRWRNSVRQAGKTGRG